MTTLLEVRKCTLCEYDNIYYVFYDGERVGSYRYLGSATKAFWRFASK